MGIQLKPQFVIHDFCQCHLEMVLLQLIPGRSPCRDLNQRSPLSKPLGDQ